MRKAPVSTGAEYTFPNFTLAPDDNKLIKSDKSSSWTHNPLSPLLKIIADYKADKAPYYMAESVFAMRLVNLRSVTCYTDQHF